MWVVLDAEFDSLNPTRCWVVGCKDIESGKYYEFTSRDAFSDFTNSVTVFIGHNIIGFDLPSLERIWDIRIPKEKVIDTLVLSRLVWYGKPGGHSVASWGRDVGMSKVFVEVYDDPEQMPLYKERCRYDVEIQEKIWNELKEFVFDPKWQEAIRVEHELAYICDEMTRNGFYFNKKEAEVLLEEITNDMRRIEKEMEVSIPPVVDSVTDYKLKRKIDGEYDKRSQERINSGLGDFIDTDTYRVTVYRSFNPASPKDRIELLNASGWQPVNKTKGHIKAERKKDLERLEHFKIYGWTCDEDNLNTLPSNAPEGARRLAEWLTLEGRRSDLVEWLDAYDERTGRIHGRFNHIGSWTHRCSHSAPNQANIFSAFHLPTGRSFESLSGSDKAKYTYDARLRALWGAEEGKLLVGADAEGIQLRVLAHLMGDKDYIEAVANGKKEDSTDVHNVNRRALQLAHITRDDAKTFIYAWLLGAGTGKVSSILRTSTKLASQAVDSFIKRFPGLLRIKKELIPSDARRGYFVGLDGRKVVCNSQHLMLAGYLQNGEKVIMSHALVYWYYEAKRLGYKFKLVDFVHDEWQVEVEDRETGEKIGELMCKGLEWAGKKLDLSIPITGEYRIGNNWLETH